MNTNFLLTLCALIVVVPLASMLLLTGFARAVEYLMRKGATATPARSGGGRATSGPLHPAAGPRASSRVMVAWTAESRGSGADTQATKTMKRLLTFVMLATSFAALAQAQPKGQDFEAAGRLARVLALKDPMIVGAIPTYYSLGYEQHARDLQHFLSGERLFARKALGVDVPLTLAVLDTRQWSEAEKQLPYGMPSVSSKPYVALMPANWADAKGFFPKMSDIDPAVVKAVEARGVNWTQVNSREGDLIGAHEVGHVVEDLYGIVPGTRWLNEMLTSYVMYAYLQSQRRDLLWLWPVAIAQTHWRRPVAHVSLDDFESLYLQILTDPSPSDNYGWYQGQFYDQIEKVYAQKGIGFLKEVRAAFPRGPKRFALGNAETLRRLEKISPGFIAWAHAMDSKPRQVAHQ